MTTLLILGGTSEAADLAAALADVPSLQVITALAGRTTMPRRPPSDLHIGGFGGRDGLAAFLRARAVDLLIDATHPFATQISRHAACACDRLDVPRLQLTRPAWQRREGDMWHEVDDVGEAARALHMLGRTVFLSTGHKNLESFSTLDDHWFLIRTVEPIRGPKPKHCFCLQAKGPFREDKELQLLRHHHIDVLVTKASGGAPTYPKIAAARRLGLPVVMIRRPGLLPGATVDSVDAAQDWIRRRVSG